MPANWIALLILGVAAGILSGMFGIGGGVVIVPILTTFFAFELRTATGTSLATLLLPLGIFAVIAYYRAGKLKIPVAVPVAAGLVIGSWIGANVAFALPTKALQIVYGCFLIYASWRFLEPRKWLAEIQHRALPAPPTEGATNGRWYLLVLVGVIAGVAAGLFGIGGGLVIVPVLITFLHFDQRSAVGTSLGALLMPVSLPAVITYYESGKVLIATAVMIGIGLIFGAFAGAKIALGLSPATVKRLYGIFLVVVALRFILGS
ncbi:MAG TPA: sulfite exporter TauE/SafE family protein [Phototrophicaceae bacterium]|nr:sulfite exporter TauE/SafE family protein [Phototrophicaceae bacterium]